MKNLHSFKIRALAVFLALLMLFIPITEVYAGTSANGVSGDLEAGHATDSTEEGRAWFSRTGFINKSS